MKMANCTTQIKLKNVLLATDLSEASLHATRYAISLAARYGGKLYETASPAVQLLSQALRELISLHAELFYEPEIAVTGGPVADRILEFAAERSANLIVMGVRGVGAFASQASRFGSIAHEVISRSPCPVLTTSVGEGSPVTDPLQIADSR